jgi:hypothetical protein
MLASQLTVLNSYPVGLVIIDVLPVFISYPLAVAGTKLNPEFSARQSERGYLAWFEDFEIIWKTKDFWGTTVLERNLPAFIHSAILSKEIGFFMSVLRGRQ